MPARIVERWMKWMSWCSVADASVVTVARTVNKRIGTTIVMVAFVDQGVENEQASA